MSWNQRERTEAAKLLHPQFEYVSPLDAVEPGTLQGTGGFAKVREIFPENRVEPERYIEVGDDVVVVLRTRAKSERGVEVDWKGAHVWTVREGMATRLRWFNEIDEALEAAGLSE